jgi:hypothetical protein
MPDRDIGHPAIEFFDFHEPATVQHHADIGKMMSHDRRVGPIRGEYNQQL